MRYGVCAGYDNAAFLKECGYDYIEMSLAAIADMSDKEFKKCAKTLEKADIKALAFNCFFPGTIKLVGPQMNLEVIKEYAKIAIERAATLGAETLVIGSGKSRNIEDGFNAELCEKQFTEVLAVLGEIAEKYGITIVIEPLNKSETNFINTVREAVRVTSLCECDNVKALVDFFHFSMENEPDCDITDSKGAISHVHLARGTADRGVPNSENLALLEKWAGLLKQIGYDNKLSIEATAKDFKKEIKAVREMLSVFGN